MDGNDGTPAPDAGNAETTPGDPRDDHPDAPDDPAKAGPARPREPDDRAGLRTTTPAVLGGPAAEAAGTPAHGTPAVSADPPPDGAPEPDARRGRLDPLFRLLRRPGAPAGGGRSGDDGGPLPGRHFRGAGSSPDPRRVALLAAIFVPLIALALLVGGWAIDAAALSGQVMRNVEIAGQSVGGLGEDSLPDVMEEIAADIAARPVTITSDGNSYETTAGELGLALDQDRTATEALDAGRDQPVVLRPFSWAASFVRRRQVPIRYTVSESDVTATLLELQGDDIRSPADPSIELTDQGFVLVPGRPGLGVDAEEVARKLPEAAARSADGPIEIGASRAEFAPRFSNEQAQELADEANRITADGLVIRAGDRAEVTVDAQQLRSWIRPDTSRGELRLAMKGDAVKQALPELFSSISAEPQDAGFTLEGGRPVVTPSSEGVRCCGGGSPQKILQALREGAGELTLEVEIIEPELTTAEAEELGIEQPVGGNHAWRDGAPTTAGPGFTTYHAAGQSRVTNIHRMADLVRGALVLPGESFSINEHVGPRTREKGFVGAGAIRDGEHVEEVGGGVSQFATTLFNAAYFAGLDIPTYQAHSEYFSRYPRGREATMGHPAPDLVIRNTTPYGVLIWTSYTDTSLTVTMYSSPYATAEQTGISESQSGNCTVVTTTRTRTYPDGSTENDTFRATYRPAEGVFC